MSLLLQYTSDPSKWCETTKLWACSPTYLVQMLSTYSVPGGSLWLVDIARLIPWGVALLASIFIMGKYSSLYITLLLADLKDDLQAYASTLGVWTQYPKDPPQPWPADAPCSRRLNGHNQSSCVLAFDEHTWRGGSVPTQNELFILCAWHSWPYERCYLSKPLNGFVKHEGVSLPEVRSSYDVLTQPTFLAWSYRGCMTRSS
ncbi:hypothetical protein VNO77_14635 [Canavalia gladiata]|uniref:Uncharacterized protein n=1 Tax=Canavalia gladiata TaxID=3824 RepID=A0AAN9LZ06_CANGL